MLAFIHLTLNDWLVVRFFNFRCLCLPSSFLSAIIPDIVAYQESFERSG
jgi:hypothetical protein